MGKLLLVVAFCLVALAASMSSLTKEEKGEGESYLVEGGLARQARDAEPKKNDVQNIISRLNESCSEEQQQQLKIDHNT